MLLPGSKGRQCFLAHHLSHGNLALRVRLLDFRIDRGIVKADSCCVRGEIAKVNSVDASPIDRTEAHGAGFAGSVEIAALKLEESKFLAGLANGQYFSVRRGIVGRCNLIRGFRYDVAIFCDDGAERTTAPGAYIIKRELNRAGHESFVHGAWFRHPHCVIVKGVLTSATRACARKSVVMDSFAAAVEKVSISGVREYAKFFCGEARPVILGEKVEKGG